MPNRIVREGILSSEAVNQLSCTEEVFYRRLLSVVDDFGRYHAHPSLLRAACYPLQLDKVGNADLTKWLLATEKAGLVSTYHFEGKDYLQVLKFDQRVRAEKSKYPPPTADGSHLSVICQTSARLDGDVVEDGDGRKTLSPKRSSKTALPKGFAVSERVRIWAEKQGHTDLDKHLESFTGRALSNGYTYVDWDEAFMRAIRENWAKLVSTNTVRSLVL